MKTVSLTCPYCGNVFTVIEEEESSGPRTVLCDTENTDGCDRYFAARVSWQYRVEYYRMEMVDDKV